MIRQQLAGAFVQVWGTGANVHSMRAAVALDALHPRLLIMPFWKSVM